LQTGLAGVAVLAVLAGMTGCDSSTVATRGDTAPRPVQALPDVERGLLIDSHPLPADRELADLTESGRFVFGTTDPVVIDTTTFTPQIAPANVAQDDARRVKMHLPLHTRPESEIEDPGRALRGFQLGGIGNDPVVDETSITQFSGLDSTGWVPPDPSLAVGPNHVVVSVNQSIAWYTKDGTAQFQQILGSQGSPGFFEPVGAGTFAFDPKCFYDHYADRFLVLALEVYSSTAYITIAVSDDSNPNGTWYKYRTDAVINIGGDTYWWDYPGLGFDEDAYYVTGNLFGLNNNGFAGAGFRAFNKTPLLTGAPATYWTARDGNSASVQAAQHLGDNGSMGGAAYFARANGGSSIKIHAIEDPIGSPQLFGIDIAVPAFSNPGNPPVSGGGNIFALGNRIMNVVWRNGSLFATHATSIGGVAKPAWYEFDLNNWPNGSFPSLAQAGIVDPGANIEGFFPAIYANDNGDVGMTFGTSSASRRISMLVTGRKAGDPAGSMGVPVSIRLSPAGIGGSDSRWGDYYDAALDPDGVTFWGIGQTQENGIGWDTRIASFRLLTTSCGTADLAEPFGTLDLADINAFVAGFTGNLPQSDLAAPFGVWDLADINAFIAAFAAGCP
jgi:hypothetical protein